MSTIAEKFERKSTLADQLLGYVREQAKLAGIITQQTIDEYENILAMSRKYQSSKSREAELEKLIQASVKIPGDEKLKISQLMAVEAIVLNAVSNMDQARMTPSAYERFSSLFGDGLASENPDAFIALLQETKKEMLLSIVHTMHPTIYHTEFGRHAEKDITRALEGMVNATKRLAPVDPEAKSKQFEIAKKAIGNLLLGMKGGEDGKGVKQVITHTTQVTIPQENKTEVENLDAMNIAISEVLKEYNRALDDVMKDKALAEKKVMTESRRLLLNDCKLNKDQVEVRTWGQSSDADGREKATSIELAKTIARGVDEGKGYVNGPMLDGRENRKQHEDCVSALIQANYKKSIGRKEENGFAKFCDEFARTNESSEKNPNWSGPKSSIYQQLTKDNQAEFIKKLIVSDYKLVPSDLRADVLAFNEMFLGEFKNFIKKHEKLLRAELPHIAPEDISLENLNDVWEEPSEKYHEGRTLALALREQVAKRAVNMPGKKEPQYFVLNEDFTYERAHFDAYKGMFSGLDGAETIKDDSKKEIIVKKPLANEERKKLMDVVKRLQILDDGIARYGKAVSDRYQIANFERKADFYNAMLLFKEAGTLKIENGEVVREVKDGKVVSPKIGIQPLLETTDDMENGKKLFGELLEDPLALSFWKARGNNAEIMLGCSDGAKSGGNFASEWAVYKCSRDLKELFATKGIKLRVFLGRGRGPDRGGQLEEGHDMLMLPPVVQEDMKLDVTLQSDKPSDMANSPAEAQNTIASMVVGTINAKKTADTLLKQKEALVSNFAPMPDENPVLAKSRLRASAEEAWVVTPAGKSEKSFEDGLEFIAEHSESEYRRLVAKNKDTLTFLSEIHDNALKSSRKIARGGKIKNFDGTRAITIEYGFNLADLPAHNIGLKSALEQFIKEDREVLDKNGKPFKGAAALELLYDTHPYFRGMMDKVVRGMRKYDPVIFQNYAKTIGVEEWAKNCTEELNGLWQLAENIRNKKVSRDAIVTPEKKPGDYTAALRGVRGLGDEQSKLQEEYRKRESRELRYDYDMHDTAAHVLALSTGRDQDGKAISKHPFKPKADSQEAAIMRNAVFCASMEVSRRGTPPEMTASVDGIQWRH